MAEAKTIMEFMKDAALMLFVATVHVAMVLTKFFLLHLIVS